MSGPAVAVILSAGGSTRFGGRPKALLSIWEEPAIERVVRIAREAGFEPSVVLGAHAIEIRKRLPAPFPVLVENPDWPVGRTGSIQAGLAAADPAATVLLWPVDHPFVQAKTLRRLRSAAEHDAMGVWFIPTFEGSGGHPILLKPAVFPRIRSLAPTDPLRVLIPGLGPQVVRVPVDDPGVRANVDTEGEYQRFLAHHPRPEESS